jgi:hypothetical protein
MKFLIGLWLTLVATAAFADQPHLYSCYILRLDKGETMRGPIEGVVLPDRKVTFTLRDGMELHGPMVIQLCDGHLEILKP